MRKIKISLLFSGLLLVAACATTTKDSVSGVKRSQFKTPAQPTFFTLVSSQHSLLKHIKHFQIFFEGILS